MTLGEWLNRWMEDYGAATLRPNTLRSYDQFIRCHIKPYLGDKIVSWVARMDILKLYRKLKHEGRVLEYSEYGHELSDTMVLRIHAMAPPVPEGRGGSPCDRPGPRCPRPAINPSRSSQRSRWTPSWRRWTATRSGRTSTRRPDTEGPSVGERPQGWGVGERRNKDQPGAADHPPAAQHVQRLRERKKHAISQWSFPKPLAPEKPVRPSAAYYWMKRILKAAGLPAIRFHDLRHTFATHALTSSVDAKTLSGILGHTNASFTLDTYTHVTSDMQQEASHIIGGFLENLLRKGLKPRQKNRPEGGARHG